MEALLFPSSIATEEIMKNGGPAILLQLISLFSISLFSTSCRTTRAGSEIAVTKRQEPTVHVRTISEPAYREEKIYQYMYFIEPVSLESAQTILTQYRERFLRNTLKILLHIIVGFR